MKLIWGNAASDNPEIHVEAMHGAQSCLLGHNRRVVRVVVVRHYNQVINSAPGGNLLAGPFDLDKYVVGKTVDGLFLPLGEEEKKIRKYPAAQTTALLKEVFGRR